VAAVSIVMKLLMKNPAKLLGSDTSVDTVQQHPFFNKQLQFIPKTWGNVVKQL